MAKIETLEIGTRIYYTGDMANIGSFGTIIDKVEDALYGAYYTIEYDDERFEGDTRISKVPASNFSAGPGCRFKTVEQYNKERNEMYAKYYGIKR